MKTSRFTEQQMVAIPEEGQRGEQTLDEWRLQAGALR